MNEPHRITSACRYCRHYCPEGRRGGLCNQLGVEVQANWKSCSFALPPFVTPWEKIQDIVLLENSLNISEGKQETIQAQKKLNESKTYQPVDSYHIA
ncbi:MAG: hypothetical protein EA365_08000 [Gloeocapsa sp. DLM2.Bin57]|nr:MAG: hypothetical protein EA365_08000 [Gloeocapsa sp. DLM2.Bin57]